MKKNIEIRNAIEKKRLKYYEVAEVLGIGTAYFSVLLQRELPQARKEQILKAIEEYKI